VAGRWSDQVEYVGTSELGQPYPLFILFYFIFYVFTIVIVALFSFYMLLCILYIHFCNDILIVSVASLRIHMYLYRN
jgi:hypothetical protein